MDRQAGSYAYAWQLLMSTDIIARLTDLMGFAPPDSYLNVLQNYPSVLMYAMRALDDSDAEGTVADVEFMSSLESVLALNCEARSDALVQPDGVELLWPEQFMIIGETGSGDYYCIDVLDEVEGVIQYDHQAVQFEVCADSLDEFIEMLVDTFINYADEAE